MAKDIHGVHVEKLNVVKQTLKETPDQGQIQFQVADIWTGPAQHRTETRDITGPMVQHSRDIPHVVIGDEPQPLLGQDQGISPIELLLTAVTHCVGTTLSYHAALQGIALRSLDIDASGDINLVGFLGLDKQVPARLSQLDLAFCIDSDASTDELLTLIELALVRSPVVNTVSQGTSLHTSLNHVNAAAMAATKP